jgi:hypothetical protein
MYLPKRSAFFFQIEFPKLDSVLSVEECKGVMHTEQSQKGNGKMLSWTTWCTFKS